MGDRGFSDGFTVIAFDIDGVLTPDLCFTPEQVRDAAPRPSMIKYCNDLYSKYFVVIYTARRDELIPATLQWLKKHGIRYHAFSNQKMVASYYIDDRAGNPVDKKLLEKLNEELNAEN